MRHIKLTHGRRISPCKGVPMCTIRWLALVSLAMMQSLLSTGCGSAPVECVGAACVCDSSDCNLACGGASEAGCALKCGADNASCAMSCPGGSCNVECSGSESCTLDCPGGSCNLSCTGAKTCQITSCEKSCNLSCGGAASCSSSCDATGSCNTSP
jgi:hypothetical protein